MNNTISRLLAVASLPGTTASGIARSGQLVELTPMIMLQVDATAARHELIVLTPTDIYHEMVAGPTFAPKALTAAEYPVLAEIWNNEEDDIFDTV